MWRILLRCDGEKSQNIVVILTEAVAVEGGSGNMHYSTISVGQHLHQRLIMHDEMMPQSR